MRKFPHWLRWILIYLAVWIVIFGLFTIQMQISTTQEWSEAIKHSLAQWGAWILLAPAIMWFTIRFSLHGTNRSLRNVGIHIVLSLLIGILADQLSKSVFRPEPANASVERQAMRGPDRPPPGRNWPGGPDFSRQLPPGERPPPPGRGRPGHTERAETAFTRLTKRLHISLPLYWTIVGIQSVLLFGRQLRQRELQTLELQSKLTQAQLDTLRLQLQPHFLFNALNAIATLVHRDADKADEMLGNLSKLLRGVLEERDANVVTLSKELSLLNAYVSIEQVRFGDRVQYAEQIAADCLQARIPTLLLQPLVENAIRHGLEPLGKPGNIWLAVERRDQQIRIRIEDDGVGRHGTNSKGWGIGLANAETRLETLYGSGNFQLELTDREGGGTSLHITFPFEEES
ncbi:MAG: two-component sensor histidine kinase [Verrucomicrobiales bacterium]|jgi:two-component sensor histidine kinase